VRAALVLLVLVACREQPSGSPPPPKTTPPSSSFPFPTVEVSLKEPATGPGGLKLELVGPIQESRCPSEVRCVERGRVKLGFRFTLPGGSPGDVTMGFEGGWPSAPPFGPVPPQLQGIAAPSLVELSPDLSVALLRVDPYPRTPEKEPDSAYVATLVVIPPQDVAKLNAFLEGKHPNSWGR